MNAELDAQALEVARLAVEDALIELRDLGIGIICGANNGFVVKYPDGSTSNIIRLGTRDGLRIGINAYLQAIATREVDA